MKTVKRKAELGERVLVTKPMDTGKRYDHGDILEVTNLESDLSVTARTPGGTYATLYHHEYEVIEDEPKKSVIPVPEGVNLITVDDEGNPLPPHSSHYHQNGLDPLEVMRRTFPPEQYEGFLRGSLLKYTMRYDRKGQEAEDLEKAEFYSEELKRWKEDAE